MFDCSYRRAFADVHVILDDLPLVRSEARRIVSWQDHHTRISVSVSTTAGRKALRMPLETTHAPASAASFANRIVSRVLEPPTPATMGTNDRAASSRVFLVNWMSCIRSSRVYMIGPQFRRLSTSRIGAYHMDSFTERTCTHRHYVPLSVAKPTHEYGTHYQCPFQLGLQYFPVRTFPQIQHRKNAILSRCFRKLMRSSSSSWSQKVGSGP